MEQSFKHLQWQPAVAGMIPTVRSRSRGLGRWGRCRGRFPREESRFGGRRREIDGRGAGGASARAPLSSGRYDNMTTTSIKPPRYSCHTVCFTLGLAEKLGWSGIKSNRNISIRGTNLLWCSTTKHCTSKNQSSKSPAIVDTIARYSGWASQSLGLLTFSAI